MNKESVNVEQLQAELEQAKAKIEMDHLKSERDFFQKKMTQAAEMAKTGRIYEIQQENAALTAQLEEVKGKLALVLLIADHEDLDDCQCVPDNPHFEIYTYDKHPKCGFCQLKAVSKALSPDIQRYREEIEREAYELAIKDAIAVISKGYFHLIGTGTMTEALESLLPKQKEVSDER